MKPRNKPVKVRLTQQDYDTLNAWAARESSTPGGLASRIVGAWCFERRTQGAASCDTKVQAEA